jgi:aminoglycoside phosphotransferase (APT) family kinase protein
MKISATYFFRDKGKFMSKPFDLLPSPETVQRVLDTVEPGRTLVTFDALPGSFSNYTHVVEAQTAQNTDFRLVIRRYKVFGDYDRGEKAAREFKTFELLARHGVPAPRPLLLDESGELLELPGFVMEFVPGEQMYEPADPVVWTRAMAVTLAKIHSIPCDDETQKFLLDADAEVSWFIRSESPPEYMQKHPNGVQVWEAVRELFPKRAGVQPGLVHVDYWPGNILWQGNEIVAVLDWEEASYGDTAYDVAYGLLNIVMSRYDQAADEFLRVYEAEMGRPTANLGLWQLAASVRLMHGWGDEIYESPAKERLEGFIANEMRGLDSESF